jgi:predicted kinase
LKRGESLILDASFIEKWSRNQAVELAKKIDIKYFFIEFYADEKTIKRRFLERVKEKRSLSDADWSVYQYAKKCLEPIKNELNYFKINTAQTPEQCVKKIIKKLSF